LVLPQRQRLVQREHQQNSGEIGVESVSGQIRCDISETKQDRTTGTRGRILTTGSGFLVNGASNDSRAMLPKCSVMPQCVIRLTVCPFVYAWRSGIVITQVGIFRK